VHLGALDGNGEHDDRPRPTRQPSRPRAGCRPALRRALEATHAANTVTPDSSAADRADTLPAGSLRSAIVDALQAGPQTITLLAAST
jgi:hypothetical protein